MTRALLPLFFLTACAHPAPASQAPAALTDEQQGAYEQCLRDNMAVAMAWEMIELQCLDQTARRGAKEF